MGIGVTFAEPAIGALQTAGSLVDVTKAPYLYTLLTDWAQTLVLAVGAGVGLAAALGAIRFIYGWSLKPLIYMTLIPVLAITIYMAFDSEMAKVLGLAFDCGAVTTGPGQFPWFFLFGDWNRKCGREEWRHIVGFWDRNSCLLIPNYRGYESCSLRVHSVHARNDHRKCFSNKDNLERGTLV